MSRRATIRSAARPVVGALRVSGGGHCRPRRAHPNVDAPALTQPSWTPLRRCGDRRRHGRLGRGSRRSSSRKVVFRCESLDRGVSTPRERVSPVSHRRPRICGSSFTGVPIRTRPPKRHRARASTARASLCRCSRPPEVALDAAAIGEWMSDPGPGCPRCIARPPEAARGDAVAPGTMPTFASYGATTPRRSCRPAESSPVPNIIRSSAQLIASA